MSNNDLVREAKLETHKHYEVWEEVWDFGDGEQRFLMARNKNGDWIGEEPEARALASHGIAPELRDDEADVCTIGWSEESQKYFGWGHRGIVGFGIGDMIFEEGFDDALPFVKRGTRTIKNKTDAREAASNFAEYIS